MKPTEFRVGNETSARLLGVAKFFAHRATKEFELQYVRLRLRGRKFHQFKLLIPLTGELLEFTLSVSGLSPG